MDPKRIVMLVVGASVMVLIFSAILVPIIGDANESLTAKTYTNTGFLDMDKMSYLDSDYTIEYTGNVATITTGGNSITIDGANFTYDPRIMMFDQGRIGVTHGTPGTTGGFVDIYAETSAAYAMKTGGTVQYNHADQTLTITTQPGADPVTYTVTHAIGAVQNGQYVQLSTASFNQGYFTNDLVESGKLGYFWGTIQYNNTTYHITVSEGEVYSVQLDAADIEWTGSISITGTPTLVNGTTDVYTGGVPSCVITIGGTDYTASIVNAAILKDIPGHTTDTPLVSMLNVLPIVAMVGIILAVVGVAIVGRNDY